MRYRHRQYGNWWLTPIVISVMSLINKTKNLSEEKSSSQSTSEREVFTHHYAELCNLLSATVEELLPVLVVNNVISFEEEEEISSHATSSLKARGVLMPIRKALFEGIPRPFHELLRSMQTSQHVECAALARKICSELNIMTIDPGETCSYAIVSPGLYTCSMW